MHSLISDLQPYSPSQWVSILLSRSLSWLPFCCSKPRFRRTETFRRTESQFETLSAPVFWLRYARQVSRKSEGKNRHRDTSITSPAEGLICISINSFRVSYFTWWATGSWWSLAFTMFFMCQNRTFTKNKTNMQAISWCVQLGCQYHVKNFYHVMYSTSACKNTTTVSRTYTQFIRIFLDNYFNEHHAIALLVYF